MTDTSQGQGIGPHVGTGLVAGEAAGLDDGYVHFGGFVPLCQPSEDSLFFLDGNTQLYDNGSDLVGANVGIGARSYSELTGGILGVNLYYGRRDLGQAEFNQIGFGMESFGQLIDVRINVAIPVGPTTHDQYVRTGFVGNGIGQVYKRRGAMRTIDSEIGVLLTSRPRLQTRAFVGAYSLFHDKLDDAAGVRCRLEARVADQFFVNGYVENDGAFDTTGGASLEFRYGRGGSPNEDSARNLVARLGDPVQRRRHVVVGEGDHTKYFTSGGSRLTVDHVASSASGGSGAVDDPYGTLASITTSDADIVYVHGGVYEGQSIVVTNSGQKLLAGSIDHTIATDQGGYTIASTGDVVLQDSPGHAIRIVADEVAVIGFTIERSVYDGISASSSPNGLTLLIANNTIIDAGRHGIYIDEYATGDIRNNAIADAAQYGIQITGLDGSIVGNTVTGSGASGIESAYYVTITGDVRDNIASNNGGVGLRVIGSVLGDFTGNTAANNQSSGVYLNGSVFGQVSLNSASENRGYGIRIIDRVLGDVTGNTTNNNTGHLDDGLYIGGRVSGSVLGNQSHGNSNNGMVIGEIGGDLSGNHANNNGFQPGQVGGNGFVTNSVEGDVDGNEFNANHGHGFQSYNVSGSYKSNISNGNGKAGAALFTDVTSISNNVANNNANDGIYAFQAGDIADNTATGNGDDGIDIVGTISGTVSGNTLTGNGDQEIEN